MTKFDVILDKNEKYKQPIGILEDEKIKGYKIEGSLDGIVVWTKKIEYKFFRKVYKISYKEEYSKFTIDFDVNTKLNSILLEPVDFTDRKKLNTDLNEMGISLYEVSAEVERQVEKKKGRIIDNVNAIGKQLIKSPEQLMEIQIANENTIKYILTKLQSTYSEIANKGFEVAFQSVLMKIQSPEEDELIYSMKPFVKTKVIKLIVDKQIDLDNKYVDMIKGTYGFKNKIYNEDELEQELVKGRKVLFNDIMTMEIMITDEMESTHGYK